MFCKRLLAAARPPRPSLQHRSSSCPPSAAVHPRRLAHHLSCCSVAAWRQEAVQFKRRLEALLVADASEGNGNEAAAMLTGGGGASGDPQAVGGTQPNTELAAAEAALDAVLQSEPQRQDAQQKQQQQQQPQLDASDLQLPTLHEALLRQLAAEHEAARRQAQLEAGPQAAMIQATRIAQRQAADWERYGIRPSDEPPHEEEEEEDEMEQQPPQRQQQQQPVAPLPEAGQLQAAEGAAAGQPLPLLPSAPVPPSLQGLPGLSAPAGADAAADAATQLGGLPLLPGLVMPPLLPVPLPVVGDAQFQAASDLQLPLLPLAASQLQPVEGVAAERQQVQQPQPAPAPAQRQAANSQQPLHGQSEQRGQEQQPQHEQHEQQEQQGQEGQQEQPPPQPPPQQPQPPQQEQQEQQGQEGQQEQQEQQPQQQPQQDQQGQQEQQLPGEQQQAAEPGQVPPPQQPSAPQQQPQQEQQGQQEEQEEAVGGRARRQRKRPRWLEESIDPGAAEQAVMQAALPAFPLALPIPQPPGLPFFLPPAPALPLPPLPPLPEQVQQEGQEAQPLAATQDDAQPAAVAEQQPAAPEAPAQQAVQPPDVQPGVVDGGALGAAALALPAVGVVEPLPPLPPLTAELDALLTQLFAQQPGQLPLLPLPWPQMEQLLFFPPLGGPQQPQQPQQQRLRRGGGGRGRGRSAGRQGDDSGASKKDRVQFNRQLSQWRTRMEEEAQLRPERQLLLEAYRQRAQAVKAQRERERRLAAGHLASLADSGGCAAACALLGCWPCQQPVLCAAGQVLVPVAVPTHSSRALQTLNVQQHLAVFSLHADLEPPTSWQLYQDARSRQLQLVAVAAAETAQLERGGSEALADRCGAPVSQGAAVESHNCGVAEAWP